MLQPFNVPRTGFHAAPAHGSALLCQAVGGAFLAVGLPDFIAIEHQFRASGNGPTRAFARAFVAAFAEVLHAKINGFVVG